jgi:hypothetical protein
MPLIATTHQQPNVDLNGDELHRGWAESYKGKCTETIMLAGFKLLQEIIWS